MEELQHSLSLQDEETTQTELEPELDGGPDLKDEPETSTGQEGDQGTDQETDPDAGQGEGQEEEHHPDPDPTIAPIRLGIVGTVYKGIYDENVDYQDRWQTTYDGSTYIAMKDSPKGPPFPDGDNWLITAKGYPEAHYVRFIKGDFSEDWYEGEVTLTAKDFGLENVTNISLEDILKQVVTGISVNEDPVRQGILNIKTVNTLSINEREPEVGELHYDLVEHVLFNDEELELDNGTVNLNLSINNTPIKDHNFNTVQTITLNKRGPLVILDGNVDLDIAENVSINNQKLPRVDNDLVLHLTQNGEDIELVKTDTEATIDIRAVKDITVNGKPVLVSDGVANLVIEPSSITLSGICTTEGDNPTKTVTIEEEFELKKGKRIEVIFTNTNTASECTLNVNETGDYPIKIKGRPILAGMVRSLQAGGSYSLLFDGESYIYLSGTTPIHDGRDVTLLAESWQEQQDGDESFYIATIEIEDLEADDYIDLSLSGMKNILLVKDFKQCGVWAYEQTEGSITLAAENKPSLDWPLHIEITQ